MDIKEMIELATNPDATQEQLLMLIRKFDEKINRLMAKHPKVTTDMRSRKVMLITSKGSYHEF